LSFNAGSGINFMSASIIGLQEWFETPAGRYLLAWENAQMDASVVDIFGYHALQLGLPAIDGLRCNRMPHQWLALNPGSADGGMAARTRAVSLFTESSALPFPASSLDLVVLPHTLEFSDDPHATLREVERVLVPEGRVVIAGLNLASLWGLQQQGSRLCQRLGVGRRFLPERGEFMASRRLRDWLHLLSFEVELHEFGCYRPGLQSEQWMQRLDWMDTIGARWWPIFGAAYFMVAVKRVRGMRLLGPAWKAKPVRAGQSVSLTHHSSGYSTWEKKD
jgi:SAM-dependent methyltransferase